MWRKSVDHLNVAAVIQESTPCIGTYYVLQRGVTECHHAFTLLDQWYPNQSLGVPDMIFTFMKLARPCVILSRRSIRPRVRVAKMLRVSGQPLSKTLFSVSFERSASMNTTTTDIKNSSFRKFSPIHNSLAHCCQPSLGPLQVVVPCDPLTHETHFCSHSPLYRLENFVTDTN